MNLKTYSSRAYGCGNNRRREEENKKIDEEKKEDDKSGERTDQELKYVLKIPL